MTSKDTMKIAAKDTGVKEVARCLGMSASTLYNQMNSDDKNDLMQRFVDFSTLCGNDIAIKWACEQLGGTYVPNLTDLGDVTPHECISESLKEFSDVIRAIGGAIEDGIITQKEAGLIRKEWDDVKSLLESFVFACEVGDFQYKK
jgi:hypothetical protein